MSVDRPQRIVDSILRHIMLGGGVGIFCVMLGSLFGEVDINAQLHVLTLFGTFVLTLLAPATGLCLALFLMPLLEVPVLLLGASNQFLIEFVLGGFIGGCVLRFGRKLLAEQDSPVAVIWYNPFFAGLFFLVPAVVLAWLVQFAEYRTWAPGAFDRLRLFQLFSRNLFIWDQSLNPLHSLSIALGLLVIFCFCLWFHFLLANRIVKARLALRVLMASAMVTVAYIIIDQVNVLRINELLMSDVFGPFQNPNHGSFFGGLIIGLVAWLGIYQGRALPKLWQLAFFVALFGVFLLGGSRSSLIAAVAMTVAVILMWRQLILKPEGRRLAVGRLVIWCLLGFLASVMLLTVDYVLWGRDGGGVSQLVIGTIGRVATAGGREHISLALEMFADHWLTGIGFGSFFARGGIGYEIHNSYISWFTEFGILALPAIVLVFMLATATLRQRYHAGEPDAVMMQSWFLGYAAIVIFMDPVFSYRSLFLVFAVIMVLSPFLIAKSKSEEIHHGQPRIFRGTAWILLALLGLGCLQGTLQLVDPQPRASLAAPYQTQDTAQKYRPGMFYTNEVENLSCFMVGVRPIWLEGSNVSMGLSCDGLPQKDSSLQGLLRWEQRLAAKRRFRLPSGDPQNLCVCLVTSCQQDDAFVYLRSDQGTIPYLEPHTVFDGHLRLWESFAITSFAANRRLSDLQSPATVCHQVATL